jgi:ElaB/YqjD/DUF883 family membrane-anchored ribosome-binding protein
MASDHVVSGELKSLQEDLLAVQHERAGRPATRSAEPAEPVLESEKDPPGERSNRHELRDQLGELVDAITSLFEDAEKQVAAHPVQSLIGALVVGILVGRLLGRR